MPEITSELNETDKQARIQELYKEKTALIDKYGIFGGGPEVNKLHQRINRELEKLGVDPNS